MRKSRMVTLVLSGALMTACRQNIPVGGDWQGGTQVADDGTVYTNNTYVPGRGYWHAPYHGWFYRPYNFYDPDRGYYHGGFYTPAPQVSPITTSGIAGSARTASSSTASSHVTRGGFGGTAKGTVS